MAETISREKFLQTTALAGAALLVSSLEGWASTRPDKKLRVAVIGCGSVSNRYLPQLLSSKMIEVPDFTREAWKTNQPVNLSLGKSGDTKIIKQ